MCRGVHTCCGVTLLTAFSEEALYTSPVESAEDVWLQGQSHSHCGHVTMKLRPQHTSYPSVVADLQPEDTTMAPGWQGVCTKGLLRD